MSKLDDLYDKAIKEARKPPRSRSYVGKLLADFILPGTTKIDPDCVCETIFSTEDMDDLLDVRVIVLIEPVDRRVASLARRETIVVNPLLDQLMEIDLDFTVALARGTNILHRVMYACPIGNVRP